MKMKEELAKDLHRIHTLAECLGVKLIRKDGLLMLDAFVRFKTTATTEQYEAVCNGAGPQGYGLLVPDTMYGLDLKIVFDHHDFGYDRLNSLLGKELADLLMKVNMDIFIEKHTTRWTFVRATLIFLRKQRADKYYFAVDVGGKWFHNPEERKKK